ncbi:MAG: lysylphosphatidylglycerol synthase transmembrane domain-containing protein [Candidatus Micrarchaeaceae archaeon]
MTKQSVWEIIKRQKEVSNEDYFRLIKEARRFIMLFLMLSLAVFFALALFAKGGIYDVLGIISKVIIPVYLIAFAFEFLNYLLRFFKWAYFLRVLKIKIPFSKNFVIYMSMYSMNLTPGEIGRAISAYTLTRVSSFSFASVLPIITMDIFTDSLGIIALSAFVAIFLPSYLLIILLADFILLFPYMFLVSPWLFNILKQRFMHSKLSNLFETYGEEYFIAQSKLNNLKVYLVSMLFTVPAAVFNALSLYIVFVSLHINAGVLKSVAVYTVSTLIGIASFIPGTIGSADLAMSTLSASSFYIPLSESVATTILARIVVVWFDVLVGTAFLIYSFRYWRNRAIK